MVLTQDDVTLLLTLIVFVYWQIATRSAGSGNSGNNRQWYDHNRKNIPGAFVPGIFFPIVWTILYGLIVASMYIFFRDYQATTFYTTILVLFIANIMLNKLWSVAFFDNENTMVALLIAFGMLGTGGTMLGLFAATTPSCWVSFGLWVPYIVWTLYAIYLNWQWNKMGFPTVTGGKKKNSMGLPLHQRQEGVPIVNAPHIRNIPQSSKKIYSFVHKNNSGVPKNNNNPLLYSNRKK